MADSKLLVDFVYFGKFTFGTWAGGFKVYLPEKKLSLPI